MWVLWYQDNVSLAAQVSDYIANDNSCDNHNAGCRLPMGAEAQK